MKTATFKNAVRGVNAEKRQYVTVEAETPYEVNTVREVKREQVAIAIFSPDETHMGGKDGKTEHPCTIWVQVPKADVTIS